MIITKNYIERVKAKMQKEKKTLDVKNKPVEASSIEDVKGIVRSILEIETDEWPDDKKIEVEVSFMVVPKSVKLNITKK